MSREVLSAAVDDSASATEWEQLLDAAERDPELLKEWSRVWAVRDARDGVRLDLAGDGFCTGVMAALQAEGVPSGKVVDIAGRAPARRVARLDWRTLVPLSAAAGMAAAVIFVGRPFDAPPAAQLAAVPAARMVADASPTWSSSEPGNGRIEPMDAASAEVLNAYLMEHSNTLAERSMGGSIANARFVVHTAGYPADGQ